MSTSATIFSSVEKMFPSGVAIFCSLGRLGHVKILIDCKEDYNRSKSDYKREEGLSGSPLCLRLGSLCVDGE